MCIYSLSYQSYKVEVNFDDEQLVVESNKIKNKIKKKSRKFNLQILFAN